ncbi:Reverse transcriptase domain-containing protein, partial [Aphis craccivora]
MKIGSFKFIKWKDGYKYKAKILNKGNKRNSENMSFFLTKQEVQCYFSEIDVKFEICETPLDDYDNYTKLIKSDLLSNTNADISTKQPTISIGCEMNDENVEGKEYSSNAFGNEIPMINAYTVSRGV